MPDQSLLSRKPITPADRLIFALDLPTAEDALQWVDKLGDSVSFYKLGFQLFMAEGYWSLVERLQHRGKKIFVDLKFFDVPETVKNAVANLSRESVDFGGGSTGQGRDEGSGRDGSHVVGSRRSG